MRRTIWTKDTADRLRTATLLRHGRDKLVIEEIGEAPSCSRPGRLALKVVSYAASMAAAPWTLYVDAGEIVEMAN